VSHIPIVGGGRSSQIKSFLRKVVPIKRECTSVERRKDESEELIQRKGKKPTEK